MHAMFEIARIMNRRTFLNGTLAGFARVELPVRRFSVEQGIFIPALCLRPNQVDHQLPVIMPLFLPDQFVAQGVFEAGQVWMQQEIRKHGALPCCITPTRSLRAANAGVPAGVIEIRKIFLE